MPPWPASLLLLPFLLLLLRPSSGSHPEIRVLGLDTETVEMEMESEVHGRLLQAAGGGGRRYISYDVLRADAVPCGRPGVPYYNCRITTTAHPYTRGCESITRCRDADEP